MPPTLGVLDTPPPADVTALALGVTAPTLNVTSTPPHVNTTLAAGSSLTCVCCGGPTTPPYDAEGAMKFTVAVVLVYGIGVIGMLGIYTRRTIHSHLMEKEANSYVRIIKHDKRRFERATQQSALRNLIQSVHGHGLQRSGSFPRTDASPLRNPRLVSPFLLPLLTTSLHPVGEVPDGGSGGEEGGEGAKPGEGAKAGEGEGQSGVAAAPAEERRGSFLSRNVSLPARMEEMAEMQHNGLGQQVAPPRAPGSGRGQAAPPAAVKKGQVEVKILEQSPSDVATVNL